MKLLNPSFEILEQKDLFKHIERCGRTAYQSFEKISEGSDNRFVKMLTDKNHGASLEHGTIYLIIPNFDETWSDMKRYDRDKYSIVKYKTLVPVSEWYITTNYRVLVENNWLEDLQYQCEPTEFHEKRISVKFICDRAIANEFVRHRTFSFTQESTRFCNYSNNKFDNQLTFIIPCWLRDEFEEGTYLDINHFGTNGSVWYNQMLSTEESYNDLILHGWTPQQARSILPNSLKTELIMTGFISDWKNFFSLRSNKYGRGGAHTQSDELSTPLYEKFIDKDYIK